MNRLLLFMLLLCGGLRWPAAIRAQTADTADTAEASDTLDAANAPVPTPTAALRQARQLVLERRYDSAWRLLAQLDPRNADPAVAIEKADLALRYYTATNQLTRFAFRDLKLTDLAPDSLRQLGRDSLRYRFAVRQVLERLQSRYPENYRLARALGDYYYTVQQCDCAEQRLGEDEVFLRTITEYQQAHAHGQGDYLSYYALGYAYQRLGRFQASIAPFERSLELRPRNPTAHLNLAFVLLELRELEKARDQATLAQRYFPDAHHKDDAGFLLKEIEERIRQTNADTPDPADAPPPPTEAGAATKIEEDEPETEGSTAPPEPPRPVPSTSPKPSTVKKAAPIKSRQTEPSKSNSPARKTTQPRPSQTIN